MAVITPIAGGKFLVEAGRTETALKAIKAVQDRCPPLSVVRFLIPSVMLWTPPNDALIKPYLAKGVAVERMKMQVSRSLNPSANRALDLIQKHLE